MNDDGFNEEHDEKLEEDDLVMGGDDEEEEEEDPFSMGFHEDGVEAETDY